MSLTDIESVKRVLLKTDGEHDDLLTMIVEGVSARMNLYMGRIVEMTDYEAEIAESVGYPAIVLEHGPITGVSVVIEGGTTLTAADFRVEGSKTLVRLSGGIVAPWAKGDVTVTYEAGYDDIPADLDWACAMQCAREFGLTYAGNASLGVSRVSPTQASGESTSYEMKPWLPHVLSTLNQYRTII